MSLLSAEAATSTLATLLTLLGAVALTPENGLLPLELIVVVVVVVVKLAVLGAILNVGEEATQRLALSSLTTAPFWLIVVFFFAANDRWRQQFG